jgi:hypothetical protein
VNPVVSKSVKYSARLGHVDITDERPQDPVVPVSPAQAEQRQGDGYLEEAECKGCFNDGLKELGLEKGQEL